ncbi:hypothetical protein EC991_010312, partial [Linnemannia zychae]
MPQALTPTIIQNRAATQRQTLASFCAVCCKELYANEKCKMEVAQGVQVDLASMDYINTNWPNPMATPDGQGGYDVQEMPEELRRIAWAEWKYICHIMTFSSLTTPQRAAPGDPRMAFPELSGRVCIYHSDAFLGLSQMTDGQPTIALDPSDSKRDIDQERILRAWAYLREHNHLYQDFSFEAPAETGEISLQEAQVLEDMEQISVGFDFSEKKLVKFSNPHLLPMMFPDLYPKGTGAFKLEKCQDGGAGAGVGEGEGEVADPGDDEEQGGEFGDDDGGEEQERGVRGDREEEVLQAGPVRARSSRTLKDYAKYRLHHFCRRWARNNRFIAFIADWNIKKTTSGFHLRTTTARRGDRPTTAGDLLS